MFFDVVFCLLADAWLRHTAGKQLSQTLLASSFVLSRRLSQMRELPLASHVAEAVVRPQPKAAKETSKRHQHLLKRHQHFENKQKWLTIKVCLFNHVHNVLVFTVRNDGQSFCMAKPMVFHTFGRFVGQCLKPGNLLLRQFHSDRVFGKQKNIACKVNLREQKQNMFAILYFQKNHNSWQNKCRTPAG